MICWKLQIHSTIHWEHKCRFGALGCSRSTWFHRSHKIHQNRQCGKNKQHSSDKSDKRANVRVLNENLILTSSLEIIGGNLQQNLTSSYESLLASLLALRHLLLQLEVALKIICSLYPSCFLYYLVKSHQNVYYNLLINTE